MRHSDRKRHGNVVMRSKCSHESSLSPEDTVPCFSCEIFGESRREEEEENVESKCGHRHLRFELCLVDGIEEMGSLV